jgi:hypothetical protein
MPGLLSDLVPGVAVVYAPDTFQMYSVVPCLTVMCPLQVTPKIVVIIFFPFTTFSTPFVVAPVKMKEPSETLAMYSGGFEPTNRRS